MIDANFESGERPQIIDIAITKEVRQRVAKGTIEAAVAIESATKQSGYEYGAASGVMVIRPHNDLVLEPIVSQLYTSRETNRFSKADETIQEIERNFGVALSILHSHPGGTRHISKSDVGFWDSFKAYEPIVLDQDMSGTQYNVVDRVRPINGLVMIGEHTHKLCLMAQTKLDVDIQSLAGAPFEEIGLLNTIFLGTREEIIPGIAIKTFNIKDQSGQKQAIDFMTNHLPTTLTLRS